MMESPFEIKQEPEVVICQNDDDVELAFDPFENNDIDFINIKEEHCDDEPYEEVNDIRENVTLVHIKQNIKSYSDGDDDDDGDDDFFSSEGCYPNHDSDDDFHAPPEIIMGSSVNLKNESQLESNVQIKVEHLPETISDDTKQTKTIDSKTIDGKKTPGIKGRGRPKSKSEHKCRVCNKIFPFACSLKIHERTHSIDKGHNCPVCSKSFARADHCKQHLNTVHKGQVVDGILRTPAFEQKCDVCQKVFNHAGNLRTHLKLHLGERSFKCDQCDKTFKLSQHLRSHIQIVHLNEKKIQCFICGKLFNHTGNYRKHMKVSSDTILLQ